MLRYANSIAVGDKTLFEPCTLIVVDDDSKVARSLARLGVHLGHTVLGVADDGESAVALAAKWHPEVVLMDIGLAGEMEGIEAARTIMVSATLAVVFVTGHSDGLTAARAGMVGACGYIIKPIDVDQLRAAIAFAANSCRAANARPEVAPEEITCAWAEAVDLSEGYARVAHLMTQRLQDKEIARFLDIPLATVRTYAQRIIARAGISSRHELLGVINRWYESGKGGV